MIEPLLSNQGIKLIAVGQTSNLSCSDLNKTTALQQVAFGPEVQEYRKTFLFCHVCSLFGVATPPEALSLGASGLRLTLCSALVSAEQKRWDIHPGCYSPQRATILIAALLYLSGFPLAVGRTKYEGSTLEI